MLLGRQEAIDAPLAVAHEVTESVDGASRPSTHLDRVKEALLLYVQAKYVDHVSFTSLESKLMQLGVGARSVNGAWSIVRKVLRELEPLQEDEAERQWRLLSSDSSSTCPGRQKSNL